MTATFDRWELLTRTALADRGIGYHEATPLIEDARAHAELSGTEPWQALGSPQQFADDVAASRPEAQAQLDTQGKTPRDHLSDAAFVVAFLGVPGSLFGAWVAGSFNIPLTTAGLTGVALMALSLATVAGAPGALRASGRPGLAPWSFAAAVLLAVAAAFAFVELPHDRFGEVPALGILAASLTAGWLLTRPGRVHPAGVQSGQPYPGGTQAAEAPSDEANPSEAQTGGSDPQDAKAWFARLEALLIGRFDVPADRAAALTDEARAHVAAAGSTPSDEFPSLAGYARDLAEAEPRRSGPWWRSATARRAGGVAVLILLLALTTDHFLNGQPWQATLGLALALWLAAGLRRK